MTKAEFDEQFFYGKLCILHESMEEWDTITEYAVQLGAREQPRYFYHDYLLFPYAFIDQDSRMTAMSRAVGHLISFAEFTSIISCDYEAFPTVDLDDIL